MENISHYIPFELHFGFFGWNFLKGLEKNDLY